MYIFRSLSGDGKFTSLSPLSIVLRTSELEQFKICFLIVNYRGEKCLTILGTNLWTKNPKKLRILRLILDK
jgi:hypothetical protein